MGPAHGTGGHFLLAATLSVPAVAASVARAARRRRWRPRVAVSLDHAAAGAARPGPVIGFVAAVLVLAQPCDDEGLFHACGACMARRAAGRPARVTNEETIAVPGSTTLCIQPHSVPKKVSEAKLTSLAAVPASQ